MSSSFWMGIVVLVVVAGSWSNVAVLAGRFERALRAPEAERAQRLVEEVKVAQSLAKFWAFLSALMVVAFSSALLIQWLVTR